MEKKGLNKRKWFFFIGIFFYLTFILIYLNGSYPYVGHDYSQFLPRLIDTFIHYQKNGLSIHWFTPSFGGGLPAYHNPLQMQFSLTQFLIFIFNPWIASLLSISIITLIGYYASYRFARDILNAGWQASILGALFFISGGFYIQHMSAGHLNFIIFPLASLILYFIFSKKRPTYINGAIVGLLISISLHSAGSYILIVFGLSFLILAPLLFLLAPEQIDLKRVFITCIIGAIVAVLISIGKLFAIYSFMRHFPRDLYEYGSKYNSYFFTIRGFLLQFIGVPFFTILYRFIFNDVNVIVQQMKLVSNHSIWETDTSISLVLFYILIHNLKNIPKTLKDLWKTKNLSFLKKKFPAIIILLIAVWFSFEFTTAYGKIFTIIRDWPIIRSLNAHSRYAASFLFPLSMAGAFLINSEWKQFSLKKQSKQFYIYFVCSLFSIGLYFFLPFSFQKRNFNLEQVYETYDELTSGVDMRVTKISPLSDMSTFLQQASSQYPYEPIFGYELEEFYPKVIDGPIDLVDGKYYNFTNPTSLVYDTDELFTRFALDEQGMLEQFVNYEQPEWDIPQTQRTLNTISLITLILVICILLGHLIINKYLKI